MDALSQAFCANTHCVDEPKQLHGALLPRCYWFIEPRSQKTYRFPSKSEQSPSNTRFVSSSNPSPISHPISHSLRLPNLLNLQLKFQGPSSSPARNQRILTITDEYSGFSFAFPFTDMTAFMKSSRLEEVLTALILTKKDLSYPRE